MSRCNGRRDDHMFKVCIFCQKTGCCKDENDLYKLGRLKGKAADAYGQFGTVAEFCKNKDHA